MGRKTPLTPILNNEIRRGAIVTGNTPGVPVTPPAPTTLAVVGSVEETDWDIAFQDVAILASGHAVACGEVDSVGTVVVADCSTPASPTISGYVANGANLNGANGIDTYGNYAIVTALSANRLTVVDCSTPSSPTIVGGVTHATNLATPYGVRVVGDYAIVACGNSADRVTIVDLSTPTAPTIVGTVTHASLDGPFYLDVDAANSIAYVSCFVTPALVAVDFSTPASPTVIGSDVDAAYGTSPRGVVLQGDYVFTTDPNGDRLHATDVSTPASPALTYTLTDAVNLPNGQGMVYDRNHLIIAQTNPTNGVTAVDVSDPSAMTVTDAILGDTPDLERAHAVAKLDSTHYVVAGFSRFTVVSFT